MTYYTVIVGWRQNGKYKGTGFYYYADRQNGLEFRDSCRNDGHKARLRKHKSNDPGTIERVKTVIH